jgi:hypothetical protein
MRSEIDDLSLMDAENTMYAPRQQQSQVGERAEAAVADKDIVGARLGMKMRHSRHVVGVQGAGNGFQEHPRADVENR